VSAIASLRARFIVFLVLVTSVTGCTSKTVTSTDPTPVKCTISVSPPPEAIGPGGGTATLKVTAAPECVWKATATESWIAGLTPASGQGSAPLEVRVSANDDVVPRQGTIQVGGNEVRIAQEAAPCVVEVAPRTRTISGAGETTTVDVSTKAGCRWSASTDEAWITVMAGASGSGTGVVTASVRANPGEARVGAITVAGQIVTIAQDARSCNYMLSDATLTAPATGDALSVAVNADAGCSWSASSSAAWIAVTSGAMGSGNGTVRLTIAPNSGAARSGVVSVAGRTVTINQAGVGCAFILSTASLTVPAGAGSATATVSASTSCAWTASSGASWLTVSSGATGSGNGTVSFAFTSNTGAQRTGVLTIAGQTVTVTQSAASTACTYGIAPTGQTVAAGGGPGTDISVTTGNSCAWVATSNAPWITLTSGASGSGNGTVKFSVAANSGSARSGTMTIAEQTFTVSQAAPCSYQISPTTVTVGAGGGPATPVSVTASASCAWTAVSNDSWITVTSGAGGSGNGTVTFTVDSHNKARTGTITIATKTLTVQQVKN
jgi:hypothetical protein